MSDHTIVIIQVMKIFFVQFFCVFLPSLLNIFCLNLKQSSLVAQRLKCLPPMRETWVWFLGQGDPLEKEMVTHSRILAWKIPWMEKPGRLQSTGSQRVRHNWATSLSLRHNKNKRESASGIFLLVQCLRFCHPAQEIQVQYLVGELRSHMPRGNMPKHKTETI